MKIATAAGCAVVASALAVGGFAAAATPPSSGPVVIRTGDGAVRGIAAPGDRTFDGIPYAAPPVGSLRWRPPQPVRPWTGVRDATRPGNRCPQPGRPGQPMVVGAEDCLYLNVSTPARAWPGARLPVMVWFHGGGFTSGSGGDYDPTRLVRSGNVLVVTVNYRLGALGFLDVPALAAQNPYAGNYALADQQAALRWVRRDIDVFGGDPGNVTIAGQSAGGFGVCAHLAAPGSRGLFDKAIVQSGPCGNALGTRAAAERQGAAVAAGLGCADPATTPACLRDVSVEALVRIGRPGGVAAGEVSWGFTAGTPALPLQPLTALRRGVAAQVPLIQGSTHDEMTEYVASRFDLRGSPLTAEEYPVVLAQFFGDRAHAIAVEYPLSRYASPDLALAAVLTDWGGQVGACPVLPADNAAAGRAPVHAYEFAQDDGLRIGDLAVGAAHGSELPYLFDGTFDWSPPPPPDPTLSAQMIRYWTRFARTGDPNGPGTPYWPAYRHDGPVLSLAAGPAGIRVTDFAANHHCAFWHGR
ncbi:MAG TPA: carboxylesterase family protein [Streptosporangiaceae bacterium]